MNHTHVIRKLSLSLLLAASVLATPAYAQIGISINIGPPPPQYEIIPTISPGYVWAPGYWGWSGQRHVWVRGRPIMQREGYRWTPDRWDHRNSSYYRTAGHWEQDKGYRPAKMKKEKQHKRRDNDDRDDHRGKGRHDNNGRFGGGR